MVKGTPAELKRFGERVKSFRLSKHKTQEDIASSVNVDPSYIGLIERGKRNPPLHRIIQLAHALGIKPSELLTN